MLRELNLKAKETSTDKYVHGMDWAKDMDGATMSNYKSYQYDLISKYFGKKMLEIGSGNRIFTGLIAARHTFDSLLSIEPSQTLFSLYDGKYKFPESVEFGKHDLFDISPENGYKFDTVVMVHVLEHIEDDRAAVDHLASVIDDGGHLLIEVPALPLLFSQHDTLVGHYRRYNKKMLRAAIDQDKYEIVDIWYQDPIGVFGSLLFFKILKIKLKSDAGTKLVSKQGKFYDNYLIPFQKIIEKVIRFPFGLSLTVVVRKKAVNN